MKHRAPVIISILFFASTITIFYIFNKREKVSAVQKITHMSAEILAYANTTSTSSGTTYTQLPTTRTMFGSYSMLFVPTTLPPTPLALTQFQERAAEPIFNTRPTAEYYQALIERQRLLELEQRRQIELQKLPQPKPEPITEPPPQTPPTIPNGFSFLEGSWRDILYLYKTNLPFKKYRVTNFLTHSITKKIYAKTTSLTTLKRYNDFSITKLERSIVPPGSYILTTTIQAEKKDAVLEKREMSVYLSPSTPRAQQ